MQGAGAAHETGGEHGGEACVSAEAHDGVGVEAAHYAHGAQHAEAHGGHGGNGLQAAADEAAHGQAFKAHAGALHEIAFRAVFAAHEENFDVGSALFERFDDGERGEDVTARAAGGDDDAKSHAYSRAVRE